MKLNLICWLIAPACFAFLPACKHYREITKKPEHLYENIDIPSFESRFILALKVNLSALEDQINDAFQTGYSDKDEGTYEYKAWIKTKNPLYNPDEFILTKDPLYNPNKWWRTKDPLYNPKKWLRAGPLKTKNPLYHPNKWIETKDPAYHPNEWIKSDNPLYQPNEWIETKGPSVAVGYRYDYSLELRERIRLSFVDSNTLRVTAPISFKGTAGFQGSIPASLTLDRKNFDGSIEFLVNTRVSMSPEWCPNIEAVITHRWISNPQVEIMDNIYVSVTGVTDKFLKKIEENINGTISKQIKCESFRNMITDRWKHYSVDLPALANGKQYRLNINPTSAALSKLIINNDTLALYASIKGNIQLSDSIVNTTMTVPKLEEQVVEQSAVHLFVPLLLKYEDLNNTANRYLQDNDVVLKPEIILKKKAKIKLRQFNIYPNGDEVVVGVNIKGKMPGNLLPVSGWVYLKGTPVMTDGSKFELLDIDFSMDVDNQFYPDISSIFKPLIIKEIKKQTTRDYTADIAKLKKVLLEKIGAYQNERISLAVTNLNIGVHNISLTKEEIAIIAEINSTFDVAIKN